MHTLPSRFRLQQLFDRSKEVRYPKQTPEFMQAIQDLSVEIEAGSNFPPPWTEQQLTAIVLFCLSCNEKMIDMVPTLMGTCDLLWPHVVIDSEQGTYNIMPEVEWVIREMPELSDHTLFGYLNRLLTVQDCAEELGVNVQTVQDWVARYAFPFTRFRGEIYIDVVDIFEDMLMQNGIGAGRQQERVSNEYAKSRLEAEIAVKVPDVPPPQNK